MTIFDLSENYKQLTSKRILAKIFDLPDGEVDKDALEIILYATEHGIHCKETADTVAVVIEKSIEIDKDMFHIIQELAIGDYVYLPPEISGKIKAYLDRIGDQFYTPEDVELDGDLIQDPIPTFPKENPDEATY